MRKPDRINYEFDFVLGQTLKEKRNKKNLSLEQVAKKCCNINKLLLIKNTLNY